MTTFKVLQKISQAASISIYVAVISIVLAAIMGAGATSASAAEPWWHLTSGSDPVNIQPQGARDDVQELTVRATGGQFSIFTGNGTQLYFPYDATHEEVEAALASVYGLGNVEVPEGEGNETGSKPYKIVFTGELAHRAVKGIAERNGENDVYLSCTGVHGIACAPSVNIATAVHGRPDGQIVLTASNLGDSNMNGGAVPVEIADTLPAGLEAVAIEGEANQFIEQLPSVSCSLATLSCEFTGVLAPYQRIRIVISVEVKQGTSIGSELNRASVSGGGALGASATRAVAISEAPPQFGVENYEVTPEEEGGAVDTQAGSHPFQMTTTIGFNQASEADEPPALAKDLHFKLPPGLVGNPTVFPQCSEAQFLHTFGSEAVIDECPANTALGVTAVTVAVPGYENKLETFVVPVFNLVPQVGEPARFGFYFYKVDVFLDTSVRTGGDYGVTVSVDNITQEVTFISSRLTLWGVPGDPRHDNARGWSCIDNEYYFEEFHGLHSSPCKPLGETHPAPFLVLPSSCTGPLETSVEADSWMQEGAFSTALPNEPMSALDGCNRLPFNPTIGVAPDESTASSPSGLSVKIHVPQSVDLDPEGLSEANVRNTTVALPTGIHINTSAADGLLACSEEQVGLHTDTEAVCPEASKVATVEIKSPLLPNPLVGEVYLAAQEANPFGSLVAMYLVAKDPVSGVLVKVAGEVKLNPVTGQLVTTFPNTPQTPFDELTLHFFGGERAPLATPASCGTYTTQSSIVPWSGNAPAEPTSSFQITSGPNGGPCNDPLPFNPVFTGGTTNIQAGAFSILDSVMSREDGNQNLQAVQLHFPPGFTGLLSSGKLCGEPQADEGKCGPESLIGHTVVSVGLGGDPFTVTGGEVFITGPYKGAPFGLSIKNPAKAGPYDVAKHTSCDCVVIRAKVEVNPITAALTVTTDDSGPYKIPTILEGIPLEIKHVAVTIDRPGFTINPTSCEPMAITGTLFSTEGATSPIGIPFQVTNCGTLKFEPKFAASTAGRTSRANGASLHVKLTYPSDALGKDANIAKVKVDLPKQLPSRLTTLQKACTAATFEANPANCTADSRVGQAKAITPLIPVPLEGPAYFVSHGGAKFPELIVVLQGYGVTIDLHGETFISKAGITSSTFASVPDAPVGSFELTLPQGPDSALAANGNLCKSKLTMPTAFVAQNGTEIHESTKIGVTGCPKSKKAKAKAKSKAKRKKKK